MLNDAFSIHYNQPSDTLLKKAALAKDFTEGIKLSKLAFVKGSRVNDNVTLVKSLNLSSYLFWENHCYDSSKIYAQNALTRIQNNKFKPLMNDSLTADAWQFMAMADYGLGAFKKSIEEYKKSLVLYKITNQAYSTGISYLNMGISESKLSQYANAINSLQAAAKIFEDQHDDGNVSYIFNSIGICFAELRNYSKSLEYNKKALAIRKKLKDNEAIAQSLDNIGFAFKQAHQADSAIVYLTKSVFLYDKEKDSSLVIVALQNLGSSWKLKGNLDKAQRYIERSLNIAAKYKMPENIARGNFDLAEVYIAKKQYDQAIVAIDITVNTAKKLKLQELLMQAYGVEFNLYNQQGNYQKAVYFSELKNSLKDSIFTITENRAINEAEIKYQTNQKEKDIVMLNKQYVLEHKVNGQQRVFLIVLGVAAGLLLISFIIAYNNFRAKHKANMRIQTLMRDLHHRVKNNLQILSGLFSMQIENLHDEKTKNALKENEARLTSMNLIHSKLYLDNTTTRIGMDDYLSKLLYHIKDAFGRDREIDLRIDIDNIMLEADKAVAIGLLVNELATNSFKYAFTETGGEIRLAFKLIEKTKMLLTVSDNGVGIEKQGKDKAPSFGLKLVNLMARQLNSTLTVKNGDGVSYQLEISV